MLVQKPVITSAQFLKRSSNTHKNVLTSVIFKRKIRLKKFEKKKLGQKNEKIVLF